MIIPNKLLLEEILNIEILAPFNPKIISYGQSYETKKDFKEIELWNLFDSNLCFNAQPKKNLGYGFDQRTITINIYELANKCKEWALKNGFLLLSGMYLYNGEKPSTYSCKINQNFNYSDDGEFTKESESCQEEFEAETEPEAIFKACEWILKQKEL